MKEGSANPRFVQPMGSLVAGSDAHRPRYAHARRRGLAGAQDTRGKEVEYRGKTSALEHVTHRNHLTELPHPRGGGLGRVARASIIVSQWSCV